jgi:hypothetical protein
MDYDPERMMQPLPTAARVRESPQNNLETDKQVLADFQEISGEKLQAGTGSIDRRKVVGGIVALAAAGGIAGGVCAITSMKNRWGGIGSSCDDDDDDGCAG